MIYENIKIIPLAGTDFCKGVRPLIAGAKQTIDIAIFDWRWYENNASFQIQQFNQEIIKANARGVRVRAICNMADIVDTLKGLSIQAKKTPPLRLMHAKLMIIDSKYYILGSHNYTQNAMSYNHEVYVIIESSELIPEYTNYFAKLWNNG